MRAAVSRAAAVARWATASSPSSAWARAVAACTCSRPHESSSLAPETLWTAKMRQLRFLSTCSKVGRMYCSHSSAVEELLPLHFGRKASP